MNRNNRYLISEETSKEINVLRAVFIVMVVFIHTYNYIGKGEMNMAGGGVAIELPTGIYFFMDLFSKRISGIANSGFFFLAGLFLFCKDFTFWENLKKKTKSIVIPAIIVTTYWIAIYVLGESISFTKEYFANSDRLILQWQPIQWLDAYFALSPGSHMLVYPLWFAKELFLLNILAYPMKLLMDKKPILMAIILLALKFTGRKIPLIGSFVADAIPLNIWFFSAYYIIHYNIRLESIKKLKTWIIVLLYVISLALTYMHIPSILNIIIGYASDVISFVFWYKIAIEIIKQTPIFINKMISTLAKNSFIILSSQEFFSLHFTPDVV